MPCPYFYYLLTQYRMLISFYCSSMICIKAHTTSASFSLTSTFPSFSWLKTFLSLLPSSMTHLTPPRTHLLPLALGRHHVISVMFALLDDHPDAIMMWKDTKYLPNECILKCKHYFSGAFVCVRILTCLNARKFFLRVILWIKTRVINFPYSCILYNIQDNATTMILQVSPLI